MGVSHHGFKEARYSALSLIVFTGGTYVLTVNTDRLDCVYGNQHEIHRDVPGVPGYTC